MQRIAATLLLLLPVACSKPIAFDDTAATAVDADADGHSSIPTGGDDCDDARADVYPGAAELCDEVDQNCDGLVDNDAPAGTEGTITVYTDADRDGYGLDSTATAACPPGPSGTAQQGGDCDDGNANVYGTVEVPYDGVDNDCDAATLEHPCGDTPPVLSEVVFTAGLISVGAGQEAGYTLALTATDPDGDLVGAEWSLWIDMKPDGIVDTTATASLSLRDPGKYTGTCDAVSLPHTYTFPAESFGLELNTAYDFAIQMSDGSGLPSNVAVVTGITPRLDGGQGDGTGP